MPLGMIVIAPLLAALVVGIMALSNRGQRAAPFVTTASTLLSVIIALAAPALQSSSTSIFGDVPHVEGSWLAIGSFQITLGVHLDHLALLMVCIVCFVSALVQVYSIGYMKDEAGYARYFSYLALFTASMLGLVVADNLFQLYVCWELVGICSYLLIGFWWAKPSAADAAKKAFVVTRFGDVGFMLGVLLLASAAGSFQFADAERAIQGMASGVAASAPLVSPQTFLWLAPVLLFCGAIGKSAQFPLHVWLPDAMEGPTPVSALIHAATMVAAGVYMVARLYAIFAVSSAAMSVVLVIGTVTALIAATTALVLYDIKKVMAYSTVSQLGYMMMGLGAAGRTASMFHLTTHAMFKALLFLAAGSVIHALHHAEEPNDLRRMGGLRRRMPHTSITCLIGVIALAGMFPLSGFWSKDAVIGALWERCHENQLAYGALLVAIVVAGLTAFYSLRMWLLAFWGEPRSEAAVNAHESPMVMIVPLWLLATPSVILGLALHWNGNFAQFLGGSSEPINWALAAVTTLIAAGGLWLAWWIYAVRCEEVDPVRRIPGYGVFANFWGIDAFWNRVGAQGSLAAGRFIAWFDRHVIDRYVANGPAWLCSRAGNILRRTTTGQAQTYVAVLLAALVLLTLALSLQSRATTRPGRTANMRHLVIGQAYDRQ